MDLLWLYNYLMFGILIGLFGLQRQFYEDYNCITLYEIILSGFLISFLWPIFISLEIHKILKKDWNDFNMDLHK